MLRKIIHIDMDAFYASVEQRDFPEFRGQPLAVGGSPDGRGVVATASYEARKYGVRSAMSSRQALQLCPHLLFTRPRFDVYKDVSSHIRTIFKRYTDMIEPLSLDEAYLDVTEDKLKIGSAIEIAKQIKDAIRNELNLTASAGVSTNKFIAKIASDYHKPDGLTFIGPSKIIPFMEALPIDKFFGVGKVTAQKMKGKGIHYGKDLKKYSEEELIRQFGKSGKFYFHIVRGEDNRPVQPNRISKSIGAEDTFETDISDVMLLKAELQNLVLKVEKRIDSKAKMGRTVTLKVKFSDFTQITRSYTSIYYINSYADIYAQIEKLFDNLHLDEKKVRLLGVTLSNFYEEDIKKLESNQLSLF
ncbi:DNA polymerase IV [Sphingobacterium lumbrici]|uniref:DNA polymerase IV n=1 Tax=Sphingobacterium lumbrici TaxID=2559600 RepID=UPI00112A9403|nr:DNA polymerase IV [Sphingobacterium lumbrici]